MKIEYHAIGEFLVQLGGAPYINEGTRCMPSGGFLEKLKREVCEHLKHAHVRESMEI